jgi:hypothetical protein
MYGTFISGLRHAMEIWGKAAGGREAAAHLVFVCCVCLLVCVRCSAPVNFLGLYPVDFFVRQS